MDDRDYKEKAVKAVTMARMIAQLMDGICRLCERDPAMAELICAEYPFVQSLDEVSHSVVAWRDAMTEKADVPLNPDGLRTVALMLGDEPLRVA
jgi:hypothetical protein